MNNAQWFICYETQLTILCTVIRFQVFLSDAIWFSSVWIIFIYLFICLFILGLTSWINGRIWTTSKCINNNADISSIHRVFRILQVSCFLNVYIDTWTKPYFSTRLKWSDLFNRKTYIFHKILFFIFKVGWKVHRLTKILSWNVTKGGLFFNIILSSYNIAMFGSQWLKISSTAVLRFSWELFYLLTFQHTLVKEWRRK